MRGRSIWLAEQINMNGYLIGAEIGAAIGLTTNHVLNNCSGLENYIVVDDWRCVPGSGIFDSPNMKQTFLKSCRKDPRLRIIEGISWEMSSTIEDRSLDFVFIDASHDYNSVKKDLQAWMPKVRLGGLLSGHDEHWEGVRKALNEFVPDYTRTGIDNTWFKIMPKG
jgi:hypothetical protein